MADERTSADGDATTAAAGSAADDPAATGSDRAAEGPDGPPDGAGAAAATSGGAAAVSPVGADGAVPHGDPTAAPAKPAKRSRTTKGGKAKTSGGTGAGKAAAASTKPAKSTKSAKAAKPSAADATDSGPGRRTGSDETTTPGVDDRTASIVPAPPGAWAHALLAALRQPDQPPRRLAELAVAELGPRAAVWVAWLRDTYPHATADGIARLAAAHATRGGLALACAETGGGLVAPLRLPAGAWVRATVILRVAAAYGHDPADPARAADLVELLGLDPATTGEPFSLLGMGGVAGAAGQLGLARLLINRLGLRRNPGATALRVLLAAGNQTDRLTMLSHRAIRHYRPPGRS